jgi:hypothetical protein
MGSIPCAATRVREALCRAAVPVGDNRVWWPGIRNGLLVVWFGGLCCVGLDLDLEGRFDRGCVSGGASPWAAILAAARDNGC